MVKLQQEGIKVTSPSQFFWSNSQIIYTCLHNNAFSQFKYTCFIVFTKKKVYFIASYIYPVINITAKKTKQRSEFHLQHLIDITSTENLMDNGKLVRLFSREIWSKDAVFHTFSPEKLTRGTRRHCSVTVTLSSHLEETVFET